MNPDLFIRVPEADDAVEPRSALTGAEIRALISRRELHAIPVRANGERVLVVYWPSLRSWILCQDRTTSYKVPRNFEELLASHPHYHHADQPPGLVEVAGPFTAGQEQAVARCIEDQTNARRKVVLLYSRKSVWVAFQRRTYQPQNP